MTVSLIPPAELAKLIARIDNLEATIQRVRDLHWETLGECAACSLDSSTPHPCPTLKALEGDQK